MHIVYIDVQNTHQATKKLGWLIDREKMYIYLKAQCQADVIYFSVGYLKERQSFYSMLECYGYTMLYKVVSKLVDGSIKGNVDIDIAIRSVFEICQEKITKAYLITNDGDYNSLITLFQEYKVGGFLLTPDIRSAARSIKKISPKIVDLQDIKSKILLCEN